MKSLNFRRNILLCSLILQFFSSLLMVAHAEICTPLNEIPDRFNELRNTTNAATPSAPEALPETLATRMHNEANTNLRQADLAVLSAQGRTDAERLRRRGLTISPYLQRSQYERAVDDTFGSMMWRIEPDLSGARVAERLDPMMRAIDSPHLNRYVLEMQEIGVHVVVDSSLPFTGNTGAYFMRTPLPGFVAIRADSSMSDVIHEVQHARLNNLLLDFGRTYSRQGSNLAEFIKNWFNESTGVREFMSNANPVLFNHYNTVFNSPDMREIVNLARQGMPIRAIDELLATGAEMRALRAAGYTPFNARYLHSRLYGLNHQITELETLATRTQVQEQALLRARRQKSIAQHMQRLANNRRFIAGTAIAGVVSSTAGAVIGRSIEAIYYNEENDSWVLKLESGHTLTLSASDVERLVPDRELE